MPQSNRYGQARNEFDASNNDDPISSSDRFQIRALYSQGGTPEDRPKESDKPTEVEKTQTVNELTAYFGSDRETHTGKESAQYLNLIHAEAKVMIK